MKLGMIGRVARVVTVGVVAMACGRAVAQKEATVFADFTAAKLTNLDATYVLYGPTVGIDLDLARRYGVKFGVDLRGGFYAGGGKKLDGVNFGPRLSKRVKGFVPYGEFLIGFQRYNNGLGQANSATTDDEFQVNLGVDRAVTKRFDARLEFGYEEYFALGGQFNPKIFSGGLVYHLTRR